MATWSRTYSNGSYYTNWHLDLDYNLNSQNASANTSNISLNLYTYADSGAYSQNGLWDPRIYLNGGQVAGSGVNRSIAGSGRVNMASWTGDVGHDGNGNLTINIGDYMNAPINEATTSSINWTLPQIPRYANIDGGPNFDVVTDERVRVAWHADRNCDYTSWWSTAYDGGARHDAPASGQGWFYLDINRLKSNTQYDFVVSVRNAASGLWTNTGTAYTTTHAQNNIMGKRVL
jgi:hypothetical protein